MKHQTKRVYYIEIGLIKIFIEDKEKAYQLWQLLTDGAFKKLGHVWDSGDEKFFWPEDLRISLESRVIDLYPSRKEAEDSSRNYEKAKKMGLVSKKHGKH